MEYTFSVVGLLSVLTLGSQILALGLLACLLREWLTGKHPFVLSPFSRHGLALMFIVAASATVGSLFFSEVSGWSPCKLCWLQRIFMYPQVILLLVALGKRDRTIASYILALCLIGAMIAGIHYAEQVSAAWQPPADPAVPCDTTGVSCAKTPFFHFGYITIPMMSLTAFVLNALGAICILRVTSSPVPSKIV